MKKITYLLCLLIICLNESKASIIKNEQGVIMLSVLMYDSSLGKYVTHPLLPAEKLLYYDGYVVEMVETVALKKINQVPSKEIGIAPVLLDFRNQRYYAFDTLSSKATLTARGDIKNKKNGFSLVLDATLDHEDLTKSEDYTENGVPKRKYSVNKKKGGEEFSSIFWLSKSDISTPFVLSPMLERDGYKLTKIETMKSKGGDRFLMEIKVEPQQLSKDQVALFNYMLKKSGLRK